MTMAVTAGRALNLKKEPVTKIENLKKYCLKSESMSVGLILKRELSMASIDLDLKPWHDLKEGL